ncbi:hypothetical protein IWX65_003339 [Arthrobacter sp. CAN_A214]
MYTTLRTGRSLVSHHPPHHLETMIPELDHMHLNPAPSPERTLDPANVTHAYPRTALSSNFP